MLSAFLTGIKKIGLLDIPELVRSPDKVIVRIMSCGICGSDVHYYRDGKIGDAVCHYPHAAGHEPAGVVEYAPADSGFKKGDRVAVEPGLHCGECEFCQDGFFNLCSKMAFLGTPPIQGAYQTYMALDKVQLEKIPDSMSFDEAAMLEPMGVAYHAVMKIAKLEKGDDVAIFGAGPIGLLTLQLAKIAGCGKAFISDPLEYRLKFALEYCGADFAVNPDKTDVCSFISEKTLKHGVDVAFDVAGMQDTVDNVFKTARSGGKAILIGIPEEERLSYNPHLIRRKELAVLNVRRANRPLKECIKLFNEKKINLNPYITHRFTLNEIQKAFDIADHYSDGIIKAMVTP